MVIVEVPNGNFWRGKMVLVPGGAGFIGSHLIEKLLELGSKVTVVDNLENGSRSNLTGGAVLVESNLLDMKSCETACEGVDTLINLAGKVAGVGFNSEHPGEMFYRNTQLNLNLLEAARRKDIDRYLVVSSACVYERSPPIPTPETHGFVGDPEATNFGYGWAKRVAEIQARAYALEYGMKIGIIRPYNTYGPRDHFDTAMGHVIPTMIEKVLSGVQEISVWGNGTQKRSFVYVSDVVQGLVLAVERCPGPDPINIGTDQEVSIAKLIDIILRITGKKPLVRFDESKPSGQSRRVPDLDKAKSLLGYSPKVDIHDGLRMTVEWYKENLLNSTISAFVPG